MENKRKRITGMWNEVIRLTNLYWSLRRKRKIKCDTAIFQDKTAPNNPKVVRQ